MKNRVVITGMGAVTPIGNTEAEFWENAKSGKLGIDTIKSIDTEGLDVKFAGEVKNLDIEKFLDKRRQIMEKKEFLYEGKAKKIYATDDPDKVIVYYKDDATAGNGEKKGTIADKGIINNELTSYLFEMLASQGVKTHFIEKLNDREQLCWKLDIVPLEVITRNIIAGSMAKRLGLEEGTMPKKMIQEFSYKDDELGDPLINSDHAVAIGAATEEEVAEILEVTAKINQILSDAFKKEGILLVDFKIEFGRDKDGNLLLADEITPDTCRLWDAETKKKLDKDRFRRDMGGIEEAYKEILHRITKK